MITEREVIDQTAKLILKFSQQNTNDPYEQIAIAYSTITLLTATLLSFLSFGEEQIMANSLNEVVLETLADPEFRRLLKLSSIPNLGALAAKGMKQ